MRTPSLLLVYGTLFLALLFQLFPWTGDGIILRPDFMLVVLIYWFFRAPYLCNIGTAWVAGVLVDLATGSLLGQYALAFTLTAYVALLFQRRLVLFSSFQLLFFTFGLLVFTRIIILMLKLFSGNELPSMHYFWPVISGVLLLQLMRFLLGAITQSKSNESN
jgi:rod shape-determining protein MreD